LRILIRWDTSTPAFGHFESAPARFSGHEAWVLFDTWCQLGATEVLFGAELMTEDYFWEVYGPLPALPPHAFARRHPGRTWQCSALAGPNRHRGAPT
jgi:hypothetical protein